MENEDNVIAFRRKAQPITWSDGRVQNECDERVHLFDTIPGRCQCGENLWATTDPDLLDALADRP